LGTQTAEERFWSKVDKSLGHGPKGNCWIWTAGKSSRDPRRAYGVMRYDGRIWQTHRLSFFLTFGPITRWILHKCDNPLCVRPDHLYEGDAFNNAQDRWSRGRGNASLSQSRHPRARGSKHSQTHLTEAKVRNIRAALAMGVPALRLARIYGVTDVAIGCIKRRKTWIDAECNAGPDWSNMTETSVKEATCQTTNQ
jgi:hypothetical protein